MIDPKLIPDDVLAVCKRLREAGHQAHLVGGGIRDMLLGPPARGLRRRHQRAARRR
jgi:tRNA nucleotidyltransferase/poly(A) polymerase